MLRKGFTLVEIVLVVAIIIIFGTFIVVSLSNANRRTTLTTATKQIATLLREAQSDSLSEKQGLAWGVHFDNTNSAAPFYSLFSTTGTTYSSSSEIAHYELSPALCYNASSVPAGGSINVIFNQVSGASMGASISLQLGGCGVLVSGSSSPVVTRTTVGKVFFDNFSRTTL